MQRFDVIVVGAGFAGLYMLHTCRVLGFSCRVIEAAPDVGGTWYWNRYPGARCDVESFSYSYSFSEEIQQEWSWSHRYALQPEILAYARFVADKLELRKDIAFKTKLTKAAYDETANVWNAATDTGAHLQAQYLVMATGCLSVPKPPDIPGLSNFKGDVLHTAKWPLDGYDFTGKRVGIIGTGSSGVQCIPVIAEQARELTVFQRTPNFSIPAWNGPISPEQQRTVKSDYPALRRKARASYAGDYAEEYYVSILDLTPHEREAQFEARWREGGFNFQYAFRDLMDNPEANALAADFVRRKIHGTVRDPVTAAKLCPTDHPLGTKRLCVDTQYFETFNRSNVHLVDVKAEPITDFTADAIRTAARDYHLDTLVLATGFDAMTGALTAVDIRGRGGLTLREAWRQGPGAYLGLAVSGFPNFFMITGPGSPAVLANVILAIEQHVEWLSHLLEFARRNGIVEIEANRSAQDAWVKQVSDSADKTLYPIANSWYVGANVPGKPRIFMAYVDGFSTYEARCEQVARAGYDGFHFTRSRENAA